MARHHLADERLVPSALGVGLGESDLKEVTADRVPERRVPVPVADASHLGDDVLGEAARVGGDKEKAAQRQQSPVSAASSLGLQKERADLARTLVARHEVQGLDLVRDLQLLRLVDAGADRVGEEWFVAADPGDHAAGPADLAGQQILHHEEVALARGPRDVGVQGVQRPLHALAQKTFVVGQSREPDTGHLGEAEQRWQILEAGWSDDHHRVGSYPTADDIAPIRVRP